MTVQHKTDLDRKFRGIRIFPDDLRHIVQVLDWYDHGVWIETADWRTNDVEEAFTRPEDSVTAMTVWSAHRELGVQFTAAHARVVAFGYTPDDATVRAAHNLSAFLSSRNRSRSDSSGLFAPRPLVALLHAYSAVAMIAWFLIARPGAGRFENLFQIGTGSVLLAVLAAFLFITPRVFPERPVVLRPNANSEHGFIRRNATYLGWSLAIQLAIYGALVAYTLA